MHARTKDRINGFGIVLRFITPVMVGLVMTMIVWLHDDIKAVKLAVTNHLVHDVSDMKERLARVETAVDGFNSNLKRLYNRR